MVIALCGYMGCGKSSLGKILAQNLSFEFCDVDDYIEQTQKLTIPQIFACYGEEYFRHLEYLAICELVKEDNTVISLGGGLPIADKNKQVLKNAFVVYIDATFEDCYKRIEKTDRPIVKQKTKEQLNIIYNDRIAHYKKVANFIVKGDDLQKMSSDIEKYLKEVLQ